MSAKDVFQLQDCQKLQIQLLLVMHAETAIKVDWGEVLLAYCVAQPFASKKSRFMLRTAPSQFVFLCFFWVCVDIACCTT